MDLLIDDLTVAALEAIDLAAGEAARAAVLAMLDREAETLREMQRWKLEAETQSRAVTQTRNSWIRNAIIAGLACLAGGFVVGYSIR